MLKWLLVIVMIVVVSGLLDSGPRRWRAGHLPGDLRVTVAGRTLQLPFTTTILFSLAAWGLFRLL